MDKLLKELEEISIKEFMIKMADHLSSDDYRYLDELHTRKMEIKSILEKQKEKEKQEIFKAMYKICYPNG